MYFHSGCPLLSAFLMNNRYRRRALFSVDLMGLYCNHRQLHERPNISSMLWSQNTLINLFPQYLNTWCHDAINVYRCAHPFNTQDLYTWCLWFFAFREILLNSQLPTSLTFFAVQTFGLFVYWIYWIPIPINNSIHIINYIGQPLQVPYEYYCPLN